MTSSEKRIRLLISIPAKDEAENLPHVLPKLPKKLDGIDVIDVLVIDDGSKDDTCLIAQRADARVICHKHNRGVGAAFKTAVSYALEKRYDILLTMDADGQFRASEIPRLLKPILDGQADFVTGTRFANGYKHPSKIKQWGNMVVNKMVNRLAGTNMTDTSCGFRAYGREALLRMHVMGEFTYTHEVFIDLAHKNVAMTEVPIDVRERIHGESRVARSVIRYGFSALKIMMRSFRDYRPLKFFGWPAIGLLLVGSGFFVYSTVIWLVSRQTSTLRTEMLLAVFFILLGVILGVVAVVADMLDRQRAMQEEILYYERKRT